MRPELPATTSRYCRSQFHATTAYDILRSTGVNIGKRDYLGPRPTEDPSSCCPSPGLSPRAPHAGRGLIAQRGG